jgi:hypothetical protein
MQQSRRITQFRHERTLGRRVEQFRWRSRKIRALVNYLTPVVPTSSPSAIGLRPRSLSQSLFLLAGRAPFHLPQSALLPPFVPTPRSSKMLFSRPFLLSIALAIAALTSVSGIPVGILPYHSTLSRSQQASSLPHRFQRKDQQASHRAQHKAIILVNIAISA